MVKTFKEPPLSITLITNRFKRNNMKAENPKAFPGQEGMNEHVRANTGMTLLDYFAGKAMQGELSSQENGEIYGTDGIAVRAYEIAESMLKERQKYLTQD